MIFMGHRGERRNADSKTTAVTADTMEKITDLGASGGFGKFGKSVQTQLDRAMFGSQSVNLLSVPSRS